jgi:hypothetical protein
LNFIAAIIVALRACAIAVGRFAGYSKSFDESGDAFMPVDNDGQA